MSYNSRHNLPLDDIYDEIMDHMKSNGDYDQIRINLKEPVESSPEYQKIIEIFQKECEKWCQNDVDLTKSRNYLRDKLRMRFESYSQSRSDLLSLIRHVLKEKNKEIKSTYCNKAKLYLERFLPKPSPSPSPPPAPSPTPAPTQQPPPSTSPQPTTQPLAPQPPPPPPQPPSPPPTEPPAQPASHTPPPAQPSPPTMDMEIDSSPEEDPPRPPFSPIDQVKLEDIPIPMDDGDELEKMTFSSISSVKTVDLSDFENSIKLSDDEASIVGLPKNVKVPVKEIQDNITKIDDFQNKPEPSVGEASESDGGCSEGSRRVARTRKSNPKYSNEHFKLYKS